MSNWMLWMSSRWWPAECGYCNGEFYLKVPWDIHLPESVRTPFYAMVLVMLWIVNVWLFLAGFAVMVGVEGIGKAWAGQVVPIARADT